MRKILFVALALSLGAPFGSAQQPESLPASVRGQIAVDVQTCRARGEEWVPSPRYVQSGDFNGDRRPDFLIARSWDECGAALCGTDGCMFDTFISQSNGAFLRAYGMTEGEGTVAIVRGAGRDVIERSSGARLGWSGRDWVPAR